MKTPENLKPGAIVVLANAVGGNLALTHAIVLTVGQSQEDQQPALSVVYVPDPDTRALSKADWQLGFHRIADIPHASHPDVQSGSRSMFYTEVLPVPSFSAAGVPKFPGITHSSVVDRQTPENYRVPGELGSVPLRTHDAPIDTGNSPVAQSEQAKTAAPEDHAPLHETKTYSDGSTATGPGPLPDKSPEQQTMEARHQ